MGIGRAGAVRCALTAIGLACAVAPGSRAPAAPARSAAPSPSEALPPAQGSYGAEPDVTLAPVEARALELAIARFGGKPRPSPALSLAARELAARAAEGETELPGGTARRSALARALAWDPAPRVYRARATPAAVEATLAPVLRPAPTTHVGAGAVVRDGLVHLVVLASERRARLAPFPRDVAAGATAVLSGELARGLRAPRVAITLPSGEVRDAGVTGGGAAFRARLTFPERGVYAVEVLAHDEGGPEIVALLTVAAGGARIEAPPVAAPSAREPEDRAAREAAVVRAINETRRRHGLAPVVSDPAIADVARGHSEAMRASGRVAHVVPGSGEPDERLRRAAIPYRLVAENVAMGDTALAAHESIEESPAHLANVLSRTASRVGVGIARGRTASGNEIVYLTEMLIEPADAWREGSDAPADVRIREALWRERARHGAPPLSIDARLDALARAAADGMRRRDATDPGGIERRAGRNLAAVDVYVASTPDEVTRSTNLGDPRYRRVGVGVVEGDSPRFGAQRLWIVVLYTD